VDELLPRPQSILNPAPARPRSAAPTRRFHLPELKLGISLPNFLERRSKAGPAVFLTLALAVSATAVLGTMYAPCYQVAVDGVEMGLIGDRQTVEDAIDRVEARASYILGYDYTISQEVTYTFQMALKEDQVSVKGIETYLFDQIGEVMQSSVLTVNGQMLGATDHPAELNDLLNSIKAPYINDNTVSCEFVEPVNVTREYTPTADIKAVSDMAAVLTSNSMEQVDYVVQSGDTFSGIARMLEMPMSELKALNPDVDINKLWVGQVLTVSQAVPFLSVRSVDNVTYEGPVPYETERVDDPDMYQGYSKVLTAGVEGTAIYNADVTYLNGVEQARDINSTEILTEPVTEVLAVGTKPRPKTMATGTFQWPIRGTITSGYGRRYIFGSYSNHSGIDIAGSYGAPIAAADGGKVIFAGWGTGSSWSYGLYVVVDHENGLKTVYAHCSSLCVKAGDRVFKGQTIAKVGSTGNSTGNHCHFQVKKNNVTVSPWTYLP